MAAAKESGGETFRPSQVYLEGILPIWPKTGEEIDNGTISSPLAGAANQAIRPGNKSIKPILDHMRDYAPFHPSPGWRHVIDHHPDKIGIKSTVCLGGLKMHVVQFYRRSLKSS